MTLTTYSDLQRWFSSNQTGDGEDSKSATHWSLYGGDYGLKEVRLMANTRINKVDDSLNFLVENIRMMNNPPGTKFKVQIFKPGAANNYTAQAFVQIFDTQNAVHSSVPAAIGAIPATMGETYINERVELALLRRENEDLKASLNGPANAWERILDIVAQNDHLSQGLAGLLMGLAGKAGVPPAAIPRAVTGSPDTDNESEEDAQTAFAQNINEAAQALHTDPVRLAKNLNQLIRQNPEFARQLFQQTT